VGRERGSMRTIKISEAVWQALQKEAVPLQDTPDDVLKRKYGLERSAQPALGFDPIGEQGKIDAADARDEGNQTRRACVERLRTKGIALSKETRTTYRMKNGTRVIIEVANHRCDHGRQWFLGVNKNLIAHNTWLILVCKDGQRVFDINIAPVEFIGLTEKVREYNGQKKFSVLPGSFKLRRLGGGTEDLSKFVNNYEELRRAASKS